MNDLIKKLALKSIRVYQISLSLDHGWLKRFYPYGHCRFHPSCSEYAYETIQKNGLIKGGWVATKRILRCNPYNQGGIDLAK